MCLFLLALTVRALVPTGFMPGQQALQNGKIELTFCNADGAMYTMEVDFSAEKSDSAHAVPYCPFGLLAHQVLDIPGPLSPVPIAEIVFARPIAPSLNRSLPPLPALGPPLGSRAPPYLVG